jgi:NHL repeat
VKKTLGYPIALALGLLLIAVLASTAAAAGTERVISEAGEGNGQTTDPSGLAVDSETKQLYVADSGNHRIDVFSSAGEFEMAWGWGVADGAPKLETCGPAAPSLTPTCRRGLAGGGAGEFTNLGDIAVDNSADSSRHDIYVVDSTGKTAAEVFGTRVQKFSPDGEFLLTFGAGVITGGAEGTGDLIQGSTTVERAVATKRAFAVGQTIEGPGIPAETTVTAIGANTLTLSKSPTSTTLGAPVSVAEGPGHIAQNEIQELTLGAGSGGAFPEDWFSFNLAVATPQPSGTEEHTGAIAEGQLHANSTQVTNVKLLTGRIVDGETFEGTIGFPQIQGVTPGTKVAAYNSVAHELTLSRPAKSRVETAPVTFSTKIPEVPSAAVIQEALQALPNVGPSNVSVTGAIGGPFQVEFKGRLADMDAHAIAESETVKTHTIQTGAGHAEICDSAIAPSCTYGVEGYGAGQFGQDAALSVSEGDLYVADSKVLERSAPASPTAFESRLQKFEPSGNPLGEFMLGRSPAVTGLAVDNSGGFYVGSRESVTKYEADGTPLGPIPAAPGIRLSAPLAIGASDNLFTFNFEGQVPTGTGHSVLELDGNGVGRRRFGYEASLGVPGQDARFAAYEDGSGGELYASIGDRVVYLSAEPPGPVLYSAPCEANPIGSGKATLNAFVNPEGVTTHYFYEYVNQADFAQSGFALAQRSPVNAAEDPALGSAEPALQKASARVEVLPRTRYHCRVTAYNAENEGGVTGLEGEFLSKPPFEILSVSATEVGAESASLEAVVNPFGIPTGGRFEYVDDATYREDLRAAEADPADVAAAEAACLRAKEGAEERGEAPEDQSECIAARLREYGFDHADRVPVSPSELDFGAGEEPRGVAATVEGLVPGAIYHYRVVVDDHIAPAASSEGRTFRTRNLGSEPLADQRGFELVSPPQKGSADVGAPINAANQSAVFEASPDGESVTFASFIPFGEAKSAPGRSQYLARRGQGGWSTENINLFGFLGLTAAGSTPYEGFSSDLGFSAATSFEPPLTEDAVKGVETLYWRNDATGALRALNTEVPEMKNAGETFCVAYAGSSADGEHVIFTANGSLAGARVWNGMSLYEWSPEHGIRVVSVQPNGSEERPQAATAFGAAPSSEAGVGCKVSALTFKNVISTDGSRIFWTYAAPNKPELLARVNGRETVELDARQGGVGSSGSGRFLSASADGSSVLFTDPNQLTADSAGSGDLYRYDFNEPLGSRLTDLTAEAGEGGHVLGLLGSSENGEYAYFVAESDFASAAPSCASGPCLYLWHEGEGVRFITALSSADKADWSPEPALHAARVSADGQHLAFTSIASLTGYDNRIQGSSGCTPGSGTEEGHLVGDEHCAEIYLYDADGGALSCASCNPTGQRPIGPASVPTWTNSFEGPRYLSDDGSRLFFQTPEKLVPGDENEVQDVYEFEQPGAGTCTVASPAFDAEAGGCLYLISGGTSDAPSFLLDASSDGRDVFIATRQQLVSQDTDEKYDVYDDRVGGGFPTEETSVPCQGEACRPPASSPPTGASPATNNFSGPASKPPVARCGKGKVRRKGKCVRKPAKHRGHHKKKSHNKHKRRPHGKRGTKGNATKHHAKRNRGSHR